MKHFGCGGGGCGGGCCGGGGGHEEQLYAKLINFEAGLNSVEFLLMTIIIISRSSDAVRGRTI